MNTGIVLDKFDGEILAKIDELHGEVLSVIDKLPFAAIVGIVGNRFHVEVGVIRDDFHLERGVVGNDLDLAVKRLVAKAAIFFDGGAKNKAQSKRQYESEKFHRFYSIGFE